MISSETRLLACSERKRQGSPPITYCQTASYNQQISRRIDETRRAKETRLAESFPVPPLTEGLIPTRASARENAIISHEVLVCHRREREREGGGSIGPTYVKFRTDSLSNYHVTRSWKRVRFSSSRLEENPFKKRETSYSIHT